MTEIMLPPIALGTIVAERRFILWDSEGRERLIVAKLGAPALTDSVAGPLFRCPAQILGLGVDERVYAPGGEDAFVALCCALELIGQILEVESKRLNLQNRCKTDETRSPAWVWQYREEAGSNHD